MSEEIVKNYYQGIYLTETIMGNPNGDFIDNSPRNFDGKVFTTDKCIKFNVRTVLEITVLIFTFCSGTSIGWYNLSY